MRGEAVAAVVVVALLAGAGAGYLLGSSGERTVTSVSTAVLVTTVTSTYFSDLGALLRLQVKLNASAIGPGGAVTAVISVVNPLALNVTAIPPATRNATLRSWDWMDFVCGSNPLYSTASFALFKGRVNADNLSSAGTPLTLAPPVQPPCTLTGWPGALAFEPQGNVAWAYPLYGNPSLVHVSTDAGTAVCEALSTGATSCGYAGALFGYWDPGDPASCGGNATTSSSCFHYFPPGWYTLVVEAVWGQSAFESFQVIP